MKVSTGLCFSSDEEEWTELTTLSRNLPGRRYGHSAVVADNAMWLYGGMAGLSPRSDLWKFSFCESHILLLNFQSYLAAFF